MIRPQRPALIQERLARGQRRLIPGTLEGRSEQAQPIPERPRGQVHLGTPGAGHRTATTVVASDDATDLVKEQADYVCDGLNDEVEIQAALDENSSLGGWVQLTYGTFGISDDLMVAGEVTLRGVSPFGTTLNGVGTQFINVGDAVGAVVSDFYTDMPILLSDAGEVTIERIISDEYIGFDPANPGDPFMVRINDCEIYGGQSIDGNLHSIAFGNGAYLWVTGNYLTGGIYASPDDGTRIFALIARGNHMEDLVVFDQCEYLVFCENIAYYGIDLTEIGHNDRLCLITDNVLGTPSIGASKWLLVDGNTIESAIDGATQPVQIDGSDDIVFSNNLLQIAGFADLAGAIIDVTGDSDRVHVHGNTGRMDPVGSGFQADYFIRVGASCNDSKVWGNDGFGTWDTAAVQDLGAGTDLTTANR